MPQLNRSTQQTITVTNRQLKPILIQQRPLYLNNSVAMKSYTPSWTCSLRLNKKTPSFAPTSLTSRKMMTSFNYTKRNCFSISNSKWVEKRCTLAGTSRRYTFHSRSVTNCLTVPTMRSLCVWRSANQSSKSSKKYQQDFQPSSLKFAHLKATSLPTKHSKNKSLKAKAVRMSLPVHSVRSERVTKAFSKHWMKSEACFK